MILAAQARALRPLPGRGDDLAGRAVRGPGRPVPVRGADHRLHRRDPDAVPVRADAGRGRRGRLDSWRRSRGSGRSPCWPGSGSARCWSSRSATRIVADPVGLDRANAEYGGNTQGIAALVFNRYVFAFEATSALLITAAVGRWCWPTGSGWSQEDPGRPGHAADAPLRRDRPAPGTAADPGRLRPAQRRGHPGAAARRLGVRPLGLGHAAGPRRHPGPEDLVAPIDKTVEAVTPGSEDEK